MKDHDRRRSLLRAILAFSVLSTALHYSHNFVEIDQYPDGLVSGEVTQVAILISWPLLTAIGLAGYRLYSLGRYPTAHACLVAYSFTGLITPGHFLDGSPDIPAFWYATIFTDALAGLAVIVFVVLSARALRGSAPLASAAREA
jgi:hypothetical protein